MKKLTYEEVKQVIESIDGYTLISDKYINSNEKLEIKCKNNHTLNMTLNNIKKGNRCLECQGVIKWNYEKVKKYIEVESNTNYKLISTEYIKSREKLTIECDKGHLFDVMFDNFYSKKSRCPRCKGCGKLNYNLVKNFIEIESESGYKLISTEYKNNRTKIIMICPYGHFYKATFDSFQHGHRCKECAEIDKIKRQTHSYEYVKSIIESEVGYKLLSDSYVDNETHLTVECMNNHIYKTTFGNFTSGARCKKCYHIRNSGEGNYNWNPNMTPEERELGRKIPNYNQWRISVYERDNYTCQCCGDEKSGKLNAHHLDSYDWCKEKRVDTDNGITLCIDCHTNFHHIYGYGNNTREQFDEWLNNSYQNKAI